MWWGELPGEKVQVGGMGTLFGDYAGGGYIGELALARSQRGAEGRGEPTMLYQLLCEHYQVGELLDLVDWLYAGKDLGLAQLAPSWCRPRPGRCGGLGDPL